MESNKTHNRVMPDEFLEIHKSYPSYRELMCEIMRISIHDEGTYHGCANLDCDTCALHTDKEYDIWLATNRLTGKSVKNN